MGSSQTHLMLEPTNQQIGKGPMREFVASIFSLILKGTVPDSTVLEE